MGVTYLRVGQVAHHLSISRWTLRRAVQRGDLVAMQRTPGGWLQFTSTEVDRYARRLVHPSPTARQAAVRYRPPLAPGLVAHLRESDPEEDPPAPTLHAPAAHLALMLEQLPCGLVVVDARGEITMINKAAVRFGCGGGAIDARLPASSSDPWVHVSALLVRALAGETRPLLDRALWAPDEGAPRRMVRIQVAAVKDHADAIVGATALLFDEDDSAGACTDAVDAGAATRGQTNRDLARSNRALEQFASVASHDLLEPLRKIRTFGDRLQAVDGAALSPNGADDLIRMQQAAARMQVLINDLLAYARVSSTPPSFVSVDLAALTRAVLTDLEVQIERSGGRVEVDPLPTIEGDPLRLRQLLQNLVSNALTFRRSDTPPVVALSAALRPSEEAEEANLDLGAAPPAWLHLSVRDNGIGFEPQHTERIFEVFKRLNGRSAYEGTGIGLALCRQIAERQGGHITATSTPGQGAAFLVTLPLHHSHGDETP